MSNHLKKHGFSLGISRFFTREHEAYDLIYFQEPEQMGEETSPALECPDNWSREAAALLAEQVALQPVPARTRAIEENTVPSWLWHRIAEGKGTITETSAQHIFDRVVGAAAYAGWKQDLFADENEARSFYEETRYALMQRFIALDPASLATPGLEWAYGIKPKVATIRATRTQHVIDIPNTIVDAVVGGSLDKNTRGKWQKLLGANKSAQPVTLHFSDIDADWGPAARQSYSVTLDLLAFRHNDGFINIEALRHTTRLAVLLLDLHDAPALSIGFVNLAPLLAALAIAYDSDAGRTTAAAIAAIITAEAYAMSAELAALRGNSAHYRENRETVLRSLRNHRRAVYGDRNDYEKMSVLPVPLGLEKCPDLALVAAAQHRWDDVLELVRQHGLRQTQVTGLHSSPALALFMESMTQGIEPLAALTIVQPTGEEGFRREIAPYVTEALSRLGYDRAAAKSVVRHIAGHLTLEKAPAINHAALRAKGFDAQTLQKIENYLPQVNDIRLAITPWIAGEEFCRKALKIPAAKLSDMAFSLLGHLGFAATDIAAANAYCYGHGTAKDAKDLRPKHAALFACGHEISPEALIRMAASVQSFVSGEVGLRVPLPVTMPMEKSEKLLLGAWRQGVKSLTLSFDARFDAPRAEEKKSKTAVAAFIHTRKPSLPARKVKMKASRRLVGSSSQGSGKSATKGRSR